MSSSSTPEFVRDIVVINHKNEDFCSGLVSRCFKEVSSPNHFEGEQANYIVDFFGLKDGRQFFFKCLKCGKNIVVILSSSGIFTCSL